MLTHGIYVCPDIVTCLMWRVPRQQQHTEVKQQIQSGKNKRKANGKGKGKASSKCQCLAKVNGFHLPRSWA